jgi:hypothetical protein
MFLQAYLKYIYDEELGHHGRHRDGVDGVHGGTTRRAMNITLDALGLKGRGGLGKRDVWFDFLKITREKALERVPEDLSAGPMTAGFMPAEDDLVLRDKILRDKISRDVFESIKKEPHLRGKNSLNATISIVYPRGPLWLNAAGRIVNRLEEKDEEYAEYQVGHNHTRPLYSKKVFEFHNFLAENLYLYVLKLRKLRESVS